ncbi:MAG: galactokinase [Candidatus Latescibacterota bacterium]|nr:galactokinase [Candidatus Latescibacterota bacterium]
MTIRDQVEEQFRERFGETATLVVRAPGRVNLIGEHTDYNDGFVMPMAIDRAVWIALRPTRGREVTVHSLDFDVTDSFGLDGFKTPPGSGAEIAWIEYLRGTAWALAEAGHALHGWEGVMAGDVPIGAGLSSSAALEMATARAFAEAGELPWDVATMARLGQRAENGWVGVNCGIMDQMISASGRAGHAFLLDCRSLEGRHVPLPTGMAVVVLDTGTRRGLVDSAYNERRSQCEAAAAHLGVSALRDVSSQQFDAREQELDDLTRRRARHVISENERTERAAQAMTAGDAGRLGKLMNASHQSLRDDFEVSSDALDAMASIARRTPGCMGARMTGAGFGGCAVALVHADQARVFSEEVAAIYAAETDNEPAVYVCTAAAGADRVDRE